MPVVPKIVPTKPVLKLDKKVKPLFWNRIIVEADNKPDRTKMVWDKLKEIKVNQKEIEELFELNV